MTDASKTPEDLYAEAVEDVRRLAQKAARGTPPKVRLSRHTARLLEGVSATPAPPRAAAVCGPPDGLERIADEVRGCTACPLHATRHHTVPGEGNPNADLVFVGEAPGADEDAQGRPFVGRAGQLLTDIIEKGMKIPRGSVFICNVLKCRPPDNRTPNPEEVACCEPFLIRQLDLLRPKVICALGGTAAQTLLKTAATVGSLRGVWHTYHGIPLRVTYHPAYLLRSPGEKAKAWLDIQEVMKRLGTAPPPAS
ncbi:MAG TPA: uracil-DNA glycosylase [Candidatus Hydrogenedentes bacterium]|nr:uracil-DNA glycosylase [Candidatus Hydrogenedentota bacterium]